MKFSGLKNWTFTLAELDEYLLCRALEWQSWPRFLMLGVGPILLLWFSPWAIILSVIGLDIVWYLICRSYINQRWSDAAIWINKLGWVVSPGMAMWFWVHSNKTLAVISLAWQLILLPVSSIFRIPLMKVKPPSLEFIKEEMLKQMVERRDPHLPPGMMDEELEKGV